MPNIINRLFRRDPLPTISIMGLDDVGKTTIIEKFACTPITTTIPTIGVNIEQADVKIQAPTQGGKTKKLEFTAWATDLGGCSKLHPLIQNIMIRHSASGVVWVIDANDSDRLPESREELQRLLPKFDKETDSTQELPIVILLTKTDLPSSQSITSIRAQFDSILAGRTVAWFGTCPTAPVESSGLPEAFAWLADAIASPASASSSEANSALPKAEKAIEAKLSDMRSPSALAAKLDEWLARAEKDCGAEEFLQLFYARDLPAWDHYTHLRLAYILLLKHGRREGKDKIFSSFKDYISHSGKTPGKSFHMTMTYFWVQMVHLGIACSPNYDGAGNAHSLKAEGMDASGLDNFTAFLTANPHLVDGQLWADYYSKEVLMSKEAREGVVFPDVKGLPDVVPGKKVESEGRGVLGQKEGMWSEKLDASSTTAFV